MSVIMSRWCVQVTVWDFTSGHYTPELNQRLHFCVRRHRGIMLLIWNIHAAPFLMKRRIFLVPTFFSCLHFCFFAEEVQKRAAGQKQIQPGDTVKVCQDLRATYPKEKVEAYFVMHIEGCMHKVKCSLCIHATYSHFFWCFSCWKWWIVNN